jgi:glycosyltransferase involved in cell wall biosynthesis
MKIAINALPIQQLWGSSAESYLCGLLPELLRLEPNIEFVVFLRSDTDWPSDLAYPNLQLRRLRVFGPAAARIMAEQLQLPSYCRGFDLLFCPYNTVPRWAPVPCVLYMHSFLWFTHPQLSSAARSLFFRRSVPASIMRAAAVLCPSQATSRDIADHVAVDPERLHVVPHGYAPLFRPGAQSGDSDVLRQFGVTRPYILSVTSIARHKDLHSLVEVFAEAHVHNPKLQLVIVGTEVDKGYADGLRRAIAARRLEQSVRLLPPVGLPQLRAMYVNADLFVLASRCETFGLPALEAMACGCPVVASDIPALREVTSPAAILVDTSNVEQFTTALLVLLDPAERARRAEASLARASRFSWRSAAEQTLSIFRAVARADGRMARLLTTKT